MFGVKAYLDSFIHLIGLSQVRGLKLQSLNLDLMDWRLLCPSKDRFIPGDPMIWDSWVMETIILGKLHIVLNI